MGAGADRASRPKRPEFARAREAMGAAAFEAAEAGGRALPADAAIAEMSRWLERGG
jgi:hypothetical protein